MFTTRKKIKKLEQEKQELLNLKSKVEEEISLLEKMKELLEIEGEKIDISSVYLYECGNDKKIVKLKVTAGIGDTITKKNVRIYDSKLIDIFSGFVIFNMCSAELISRSEPMWLNRAKTTKARSLDEVCTITPICEIEPNLNAYVNGYVPLYVLQRLYYKLNNVDLKDDILNAPKLVLK